MSFGNFQLIPTILSNKYIHDILTCQKKGHEVLDVTPYDERFPSGKSHHELKCKRVEE